MKTVRLAAVALSLGASRNPFVSYTVKNVPCFHAADERERLGITE
jgi:hypothetical protein